MRSPSTENNFLDKKSHRTWIWTALFPGIIVVAFGCITAFLAHSQSLHNQERMEHLLAENQLQMNSTMEYIEDYFQSIYSTLLFISLDDKIKKMSDKKLDLPQKLFEFEWNRHGLTEIYILERDFDGTKRPFMTFEMENESLSVEELHDLESEEEEYEIQIEHIKQFAANRSLKALISVQVDLCNDEPGVVYSVPVWNQDSLIAIVAGMAPSSRISEVLEMGNFDEMVILTNERGDIFGCEDLPEATRLWFNDKLKNNGVGQFFDSVQKSFVANDWNSIWSPLNVFSNQKWWIVFQYDEAEQVQLSRSPFIGIMPVGVLFMGFILALVVYLLGKRYRESIDGIFKERQMHLQREMLQEELDRARRMESVGLLAGGVAHDLNNTLGPLVAYPEIILEDLPDDSPIRKDIETIEKAALQAAQIVQDLLTMARRGRYNMKAVSLTKVIDDYLNSPGFLSLKQKKPGIEIIVNMKDNSFIINGSEIHLSKVIMNLVINSFDAIDNNGEIKIELSHTFLSKLHTSNIDIAAGDYVQLSVCDNGRGINKEDLLCIFEPYYSKKLMGQSGTGLGLSIVYGVTKDHNGYYDVYSELGRGSRFDLYFPVAAKASIATEKSNVKNQDNHGEEHILVVDDVAEQRDLACRFLSRVGYRVDAVASGHKAVEYLKQQKVDLVIMDMIMEKGFDGLDTYQEILKILPRQKAIIASGFSPGGRVEKMQQLGAGKYIKKPYTGDEICGAVREELDKVPSLST